MSLSDAYSAGFYAQLNSGAAPVPPSNNKTDASAAARVSLSPPPPQPQGPSYVWTLPQVSAPPPHLPDPVPLLAFKVDRMKQQIFAQARCAIQKSAQYTKYGRKPWTQFTVRLPIRRPNTTDDEDLAVVYHLMHESTRDMVTVNDDGDYTWSLFGATDFLTWLNIDPSSTIPMDKYVHPVNYETGEIARKRLERKLAKANDPSEAASFKEQLAQLAATEKDKGYHWASYDECHVTFRQDQRLKQSKKLQLTIKIRTYRVGCGDPKDHGGYLGYSTDNNLSDMDPTTKIYAQLEKSGLGWFL